MAAVVDKEGPDIWQDAPVLHYLQRGTQGESWTDMQKRRVASRAMGYAWRDGRLYRVMTDGTDREVPPIQDRLALIKVAHEHNGHFGVRRTVSLLRPHYYWVGMWVDVSTFVGQCESCQRARVSFVTRAPQLNSLPIVPIGVRWSVDLAGPFQAVSRQGNRYIMIAVEGYSKWVELVPLPAKEARYTADAFLRCIIGRYGAMAEVVTDRGGEWEGAFQELLEQ